MGKEGFGGGNNRPDPNEYTAFQGEYASGTIYDQYDMVTYNGGTYVCLLSVRGVTPAEGQYWKRIAAPQGDSARVVGETPSGAINGSNASFTTASDFNPDTLELFVNGLRQQVGTHYTTSGTTSITLGFSPAAGDTVTVNYSIG